MRKCATDQLASFKFNNFCTSRMGGVMTNKYFTVGPVISSEFCIGCVILTRGTNCVQPYTISVHAKRNLEQTITDIVTLIVCLEI